MVSRVKRWVNKFFWFVGFCSTIIGLAGVPDDLKIWYDWVERMMENATALAWAEFAVSIADFVNDPIVRVGLVLMGLTIVLWPARWFWRIRHKVWIAGRKLVQERVWISHEEAMDLLEQSDWAILRIPHIVERRSSIVEMFRSQANPSLINEETIYGISAGEKRKRKYRLFLGVTLRSFGDTNPSAVRLVEGQTEYDLAALDAFLAKALRDDSADKAKTNRESCSRDTA